MAAIDLVETARLELQSALDATKTQAERNRLGQFATPPLLASEILEYAHSLLPPAAPVRFLDPAVGTGSFYSALLRTFEPSRIADAHGYEIDPHYGREAIKLWQDTSLRLHLADFTRATPPEPEAAKPNLIVCNPPYVRHHHLAAADKARLQRLVHHAAGVRLSGLAGLYCYFLCQCHAWLAEDGLAGWLIPSEFMDVNYGHAVKHYLLHRVTLLRIHRFAPEDVQFGDALVSSAVVWYRKAAPPAGHAVELTYGGRLTSPLASQLVTTDTLRRSPKWTRYPAPHNGHEIARPHARLGDLFDIKRGIATGANDYFILSPEQVHEYDIPREFVRPILPSAHHLPVDEVEADENGEPRLDCKRYLLACSLPDTEVRARYPSLWAYYQWGKERGISERYLCLHRSPWYAQENRLPAMFLCTYMGRQGTKSTKPFRFILNHSQATAPNVYLMLYPKPPLLRVLKADPSKQRAVWRALGQITPQVLLREGRVYGGGLYKMEPRELGNAPADAILATLNGVLNEPSAQMALFGE